MEEATSLRKELRKRQAEEIGKWLDEAEDADLRKVAVASLDKKKGKLPRKTDVTFTLNALYQLGVQLNNTWTVSHSLLSTQHHLKRRERVGRDKYPRERSSII